MFLKPPSKDDVLYGDEKGNSTVVTMVVTMVVLNAQRRDERKKDAILLDWERPALIRLRDGNRLLARGQFTSSKDFSGLAQPIE